ESSTVWCVVTCYGVAGGADREEIRRNFSSIVPATAPGAGALPIFYCMVAAKRTKEGWGQPW
ncbi:MAG TPA: hypothetical protein PLX89_17770, partial [Verrucomicrobiota bacterium]|nr:hypothetical protein [Verrucomicrobiota bacterium]